MRTRCVYTYLFGYVDVGVGARENSKGAEAEERRRGGRPKVVKSQRCFSGYRVLTRSGKGLTSGVKGALCSYYVNAIGKIASLRYLSEFQFQVLTTITSKYILNLPMNPGTIRNK